MDASRRAALREQLDALGAGEVMRWARRLDPAFTGGPTQRAKRVIEVALLAGRPLSALHQDAPPPEPPARPWYAVLALPRDVLTGRIAQRAEAMVRHGLLDETRRALEAGVPDDAPGFSGVGYPEAIEVLRGRMAADQLVPAITTATRRYAKRQETWFRHQLKGPVTVFDASRPPDEVAQAIVSGYRAAVEEPRIGNRES